MNRLILAFAVVLAACGSATLPPLSGAKIGGPFALIDQYGRAVTDRSFTGQYRIMYFGYTACPDACPTDLANIAHALKAFAATDPARAARVRPIFVSVDPARDTPAELKTFTAAFHPRMVGLTGSVAAIDSVTRAYGAAYSVPAAHGKTGYIVDHSRAAYLMDPQNKPLALITPDMAPAVIAAELGKWVR